MQISPYFIAFLPKSEYGRFSQRLDLGMGRAKVPDLFSPPPSPPPPPPRSHDSGSREPRPAQVGVCFCDIDHGCRSRPPHAPARHPAASRRQSPSPGSRLATHLARVSPPAGLRKRRTLGRRDGAPGASARNHMEARARPIGCGRASGGARRLRLAPEQQRLHGPGVHVTLCLIPPVTESCAAAPLAAAAAARGAPAPPPRFQVAAAGGAAGVGSRAPRASAASRCSARRR